MKQSLVLTITSLLSILFMTLHLADDVARGFASGAGVILAGVPVLTIFLFGTLVLAGRRSGYIIILFESLLGLVIPVLHLTGKLGEIATSTGGFFFIWTLIALGVTALFSVILSVRGLWSLRRIGNGGK
jgi:hypothetical protein